MTDQCAKRMKRCARCGETKPASEFNRQRKSADGLQRWCQDCSREYSRVRRALRKNDGVGAAVRDLATGVAVNERGTQFLEFTCIRCGKPFRRYTSAVVGDYQRSGMTPKFCSAVCRSIYHTSPDSAGYGVGWGEYDQLHDAEWLRRQYSHEGLLLGEIAEIVGCTTTQVGRALREHGIPTVRTIPPSKLRLMRAVERQREAAEQCG